MEQQIEVGDWVRLNANAHKQWRGLMGVVIENDPKFDTFPIVLRMRNDIKDDLGLPTSKREITLVSKAIKEPTKEIQVGDWVRILPSQYVYSNYWGCLALVTENDRKWISITLPTRYRDTWIEEIYLDKKDVVKCHN